MLSVGGIDEKGSIYDNTSSFGSNYGVGLDFVARFVVWGYYSENPEPKSWGGTSFACPQVVGLTSILYPYILQKEAFPTDYDAIEFLLKSRTKLLSKYQTFRYRNKEVG